MKTIDFNKTDNMYNVDNRYDFDEYINFSNMNNKLLCSFTSLENLDELVSKITSLYTLMYNKMFVLHVKSTNEYVLTYNIEQGNMSDIPLNTILVHRKKESNTLYSLNALNEVIKKLNGGIVDPTYKIDWSNYKNCILLTNHGELKQLNTKIHKIIEL
jgi:hypothetical protein